MNPLPKIKAAGVAQPQGARWTALLRGFGGEHTVVSGVNKQTSANGDGVAIITTR